jgi:hypothetical protein
MNVELMIVEGGMIEFEKTGIYPRYLVFYFPILKKKWRVKLRADNQKGFLYSKGKPAFEYCFNDCDCKIKNLSFKDNNSFYSIENISSIIYD